MTDTIRWLIIGFMTGALLGCWIGAKLAFFLVRDEIRKDSEGGRWLNLNTNEISEFKDGKWEKRKVAGTQSHETQER